MQYLLDANVLIQAHKNYYPIFDVPQFWDWLIVNARADQIAIPREILDEIEPGNKQSELYRWIKENKRILLLDESVDESYLRYVLKRGYASDLTDVEIDQLGKDPFLLGYAMTNIDGRCVVTLEASKPSRIRANRRIPDVCNSLKIMCIDPFELNRRLQFNTRNEA